MPDFERAMDQLRLDLAKTDEQRAHARGYIEGKKYARKEILYVTIFAVSIICLTVAIGFW